MNEQESPGSPPPPPPPPRAASSRPPSYLLNPAENGASPAPLQVDMDDSSGHADADTESDSGSVTQSIFDYQYENGRRYHAYRQGEYVLPNDAQEQERLDLQHHIWRLLLGGRLYTAPLPSPAAAPRLRVLDLGTGTGIWAIDLADEFPTCDVYGVDLSPIQPEWVPSNCRFHVDDFEEEWSYREDEKFDYIHGRALSGSCSDWPRFYEQAKTNLKAGGWLEMQEYDSWVFSDDDSIDRAIWTTEWMNKLDGGSRAHGKRMNVGDLHRQWMIDAGFEDVKELMFRVPIGAWAKNPTLKDLGQFNAYYMMKSVDSYTPALFTRVWNYSPDQVQVVIENVKREFRSKELRLITNYRFIVGRKPAEET